MANFLAPIINDQQLDANGDPLSGGTISVYLAGSSTPATTYNTQAGSANTWPITLNTLGLNSQGAVWLAGGSSYKYVIKNSSGVTQRTIDNVSGINDNSSNASQWTPFQGTPTFLSATSFSVAGDQTAILAPYLRLRTQNTGGTVYATIVTSTFSGGLTTVTVAPDSGSLDSGISQFDYGIISPSSGALPPNLGHQQPNLWTNPDFYVNQRAATTAADAAIGYDRTRILCDGGSVTLSSFDTAGLALAGNAIRLTQPDVAAKRMGLSQIVEAKDCLSYRGKSLALAFQIRSSVAATFRAALVAWTGTQDAPTADVVNSWTSTNYTAGNFFVANTSTIATASVAASAATWTDLVVSSSSVGGVTVPLTMTNLYMLLWSEGVLAQNVTLDVTTVRCAQGAVAPIWSPPNAQQELAKCKRFLPAWQSTSINDQVGAGQCINNVQAYINFSFDVEARIAPTGITATGSYAVTNSGGSAVVLTGMTMVVGGKRAALIGAPVAAGLVAGDATTLQGTSATSRFILTGAEL